MHKSQFDGKRFDECETWLKIDWKYLWMINCTGNDKQGAFFTVNSTNYSETMEIFTQLNLALIEKRKIHETPWFSEENRTFFDSLSLEVNSTQYPVGSFFRFDINCWMGYFEQLYSGGYTCTRRVKLGKKMIY